MTVTIETQRPSTLSNANFVPRGPVFPSPTDWRDQVLYFLLPDRFSDGREASRAGYDRRQPNQFKVPEGGLEAWRNAGANWQGGTLKGIQSKLGYLQELGVTTLWVGPIFKQRPKGSDYHGYAIQDFMDVDSRFGTRQDLRELVDAAHGRGIYVLLDIIYNHVGNTFYYDQGGPRGELGYRVKAEGPYPVHGWRANDDRSIWTPLGPDDGQWPAEFQNLDFYHRAGHIERWDPEAWEDPSHPDCPWRRGDFYANKDVDTEVGPALSRLIEVYKYWIAVSDCDGYRIDTCKHVSIQASRSFCGGIREYAESIGKDRFLLLGEVTGGAKMANAYLDIFGRNLDACLDIGEAATHLTAMVKGQAGAGDFFDEFGGHDELGSHRELGRHHVSVLDDHDFVARDKRRFSADNAISARYEQVAHAVGTQLTTLGMPCIYYGTEQAFDGKGGEDRYVRESMFGGSFGAFVTSGCHFFDPSHPAYLRIAAIGRLRRAADANGRALRRGRQYRRETSTPTRDYGWSAPGEICAWSRILDRNEVLIALNTNGVDGQEAWVVVDASIQKQGGTLKVLYRSDWTDAELRNPPQERSAVITRHHDGRLEVHVKLPPAGMLILGA